MGGITQYRGRPGILDLGWGHPPPDALPVAEWGAAVARSLSRFGDQALTYGYAAGPAPLREWLAAHLAEIDGPADPAEIFVTGGASHALDLVARLLTRPGDLVLVDSPTYHLALPILAGHGARVVGVPVDGDGIDPTGTAELIAAARRAGRRVPLLYTVPTFANPTGRCLPDQRRRALVALAREAGVVVAEDDTYRELGYDHPAPPSLWHLAGGDGVVRIGSFAKTVAPGLRLGFVTATPALVRELAGLGYIDSGGGVNHATALAMADFGTSGGYRAHVSTLRARYARQRDALVGALRSALPAAEVTVPAGGWFVWLPLPGGRSAAQLLPQAEAYGVSYVPGPRFYATDAERGSRYARLAFSMLTPDALTEAAHRLSRTLPHLP